MVCHPSSMNDLGLIILRILTMRGVNLVQSVWQRIIGVGTIAIGTAATAGAEINMTGIARPQQVVDRINALRHQ